MRVPHSFVNNGYKGYLEDRRPNSLGDPYQIAGRILQTIETVSTNGAGPSPAGLAAATSSNGNAAASEEALAVVDD